MQDTGVSNITKIKRKWCALERILTLFSCAPLTLNDGLLEFVCEMKYLGVIITAGRSFFCSPKKARGAFYRSSNSILNVVRSPSEPVQMNLLYSICIPNLTYACDVVCYSASDLSSLHVAANDAIRKIFRYNRWESIAFLRNSFGYSSITEIFARRRMMFEQRLTQIGNAFLSRLSIV